MRTTCSPRNTRHLHPAPSAHLTRLHVNDITTCKAAEHESNAMTDNDPTELHTEAHASNKPFDQRSPRSIRFSHAEWEQVEKAAEEVDTSPATFTRNAALAVAAGRKAATPEALPSGIVELIKRTYLSTYILSTLKRDEMVHEGRRDELDRTIKAAREAQDFILGDTAG